MPKSPRSSIRSNNCNFLMKKKTFKIPKYMTTVTPFSKMLALSMLIIFPILAFYFGMQYQKVTTIQACQIVQE